MASAIEENVSIITLLTVGRIDAIVAVSIQGTAKSAHTHIIEIELRARREAVVIEEINISRSGTLSAVRSSFVALQTMRKTGSASVVV